MNCAQLGAPGTGKTQSLLTILPFVKEMKKPFAIVDVDGKVSDNPSFAQPIKEGFFQVFDPGSRLTEGSFLDRIKKIQQPPSLEPRGWLGLGDILDDLSTNSKDYCGAALDTLTTAEDHMKRYISFVNKKAKFDYQEWGVLLQSFQELFNYFYSMEMPLKIINLHEMYDKDEFTGRVKILPLITGSFKDKAGSYPSEFYYNFCKPAKPNQPAQYLWRVTPDDRFVARSVVFQGQAEVQQDWAPVCRTLL